MVPWNPLQFVREMVFFADEAIVLWNGTKNVKVL